VTTPKIIVHSNIILNYVLHRLQQPSLFRILMTKFFCYTTVLDAIELFSLAHTAKERRCIEDALGAIKILGLNARLAKKHGAWFAQAQSVSVFNRLIAGICIESKIPLITDQPQAFGCIKKLRVIHSSVVDDTMTATKILSHARFASK